MKRFLVVTVLAVLLGLAMATSKRDERMRRIAVEEACRTIVEAGLVASCSENSLHK